MFQLAITFNALFHRLSRWLQALCLFATVVRTGAVLCVTQRGFEARLDAVKVAWVDGQLAFIYHRDSGLPDAFKQQLESLVELQGGRWLQDRRWQQASYQGAERRRPFRLPALLCFFSASVSAAATAEQRPDLQAVTAYNWQVAALDSAYYASSSNNSTLVRQLGLFSVAPQPRVFDSAERAARPENPGVEKLASGHPMAISPVSGDHARALAILNSKWRAEDTDPVNMAGNLDQLASYIASQPRVLALLESLADQPLRLAYAPGQFSTVVKGSQFQVRSATIYFDPYSAAVFSRSTRCEQERGHCVASPADAFVHELIHARIALLESRRFIRSGAMDSLVYPYAHEREVLQEERSLFQSMSREDQRARPQRRQHSGHLQAAACVTCLDAG